MRPASDRPSGSQVAHLTLQKKYVIMLKKHIFSDRVPISLHICPAHMIGGTGCRFREKPSAYGGSWIERKNCIWGLGIGKSSQCPRGRLALPHLYYTTSRTYLSIGNLHKNKKKKWLSHFNFIEINSKLFQPFKSRIDSIVYG